MTTETGPCERIALSCVCCGSVRLQKSPAILMPFVAHRALGWAPVEITAEWGLNSIRAGMAYSICHSLQCAQCGLLFLDMRFSDREMAALYTGYREEDYVALREHYEPGYRSRNEQLNSGIPYLAQIEQFLAPHLPPSVRVLDWGGDTGKNTPFKNANLLFHIYDISDKPLVAGACKVDKATARSIGYDLIVCSNVLEHVPYPAELILDIRESMGPATVLYLEVPYENLVWTSGEGAALHTKKKHWHEHINFYTKESLRQLLERCGMSVIDSRQVSADGGSASSQHYMVACKLAS